MSASGILLRKPDVSDGPTEEKTMRSFCEKSEKKCGTSGFSMFARYK